MPKFLKNPLLYGIILTTVIVFIVVILGASQNCQPDALGKIKCFSNFDLFMKSSPNEMGDTFAGIAGVLAFLWIIITVLLQSQELKAQREELENHRKELVENRVVSKKTNEAHSRQLFENTFFSMLELFNRINDGMDVGALTGKDCFEIFVDDFNDIYNQEAGEILPRLNFSYEYFWDQYQSELGHYFRSLYRIYKFLSENRFAEDYHAKLLRAQLSDLELVMLFYNCLFPHI